MSNKFNKNINTDILHSNKKAVTKQVKDSIILCKSQSKHQHIGKFPSVVAVYQSVGSMVNLKYSLWTTSCSFVKVALETEE